MDYSVAWFFTLNTEAAYNIRLWDCRVVWGVLVIKLHHKLRRAYLAVLLRNIWQVEFPQKALLHGSQEVLHPRVSVFLLQKVLLWQLRVEILRVLTLNIIIERFAGARAGRNHQTQTHLEQEWSGALHFEIRCFLSHRRISNFTVFLAWKQTLWWQDLKMVISNARSTVLMSAPMLSE